MFKPITIEEIKERLVFSSNHVFHVVLKLNDSGKIFNESFTFTGNYLVIVMDNHDVSWKPLGTNPQILDDYLLSLSENNDFEVIGFYEYETE